MAKPHRTSNHAAQYLSTSTTTQLLSTNIHQSHRKSSGQLAGRHPRRSMGAPGNSHRNRPRPVAMRKRNRTLGRLAKSSRTLSDHPSESRSSHYLSQPPSESRSSIATPNRKHSNKAWAHSSPLFPLFPPLRWMACSKLLTVNNPNAIGLL